jgi:hypothetical protein
VHHVKISKFKLKIIDPNHSIYSSYQILVENQNLYFLGQDKVAWFKEFGLSNSDDFFLAKKIANKILKNIKFDFL